MEIEKTLASIFQEEPSNWGLRGDPYLLEEISQVLGNLPYPLIIEEFSTLIEHTYEQFTESLIATRVPLSWSRNIIAVDYLFSTSLWILAGNRHPVVEGKISPILVPYIIV